MYLWQVLSHNFVTCFEQAPFLDHVFSFEGMQLPSAIVNYFDKWKGEASAGPGKYPSKLFLILATFGGLSALSVMCFTSVYALGEADQWITLVTSFGATTVLIFGNPQSPFSQPRNVIGGHTIAAIVGASCRAWITEPMGNPALATVVSVMVSYLLMQLTKTLNPPAGGTAATAAQLTSNPMTSLGWKLVIPCIVWSILYVLFGCIFINLIPGQRYPLYWFVERKTVSACFCPHHYHHLERRKMQSKRNNSSIVEENINGEVKTSEEPVKWSFTTPSSVNSLTSGPESPVILNDDLLSDPFSSATSTTLSDAEPLMMENV